MRKHLLLIATAMLLLPAWAFGQEWLPLLEQLADDDGGGEAIEQAAEVLADLEQHPLDINAATRDDWQQLPFLNADDVEAICEYTDRYRPVKSLGELAMIGQLDYVKRQLLTHFVSIGTTEESRRYPSAGTILRHARHELMATARIPTYERRGDDNGYLGYPYRHDLRYSMSYGQRFRAGLVGAQDAGEPFFSNRNGAGYDFYSAYLMVRDAGRLKALAVGRYRLSAGMGLVMNNSLMLGKQWAVDALPQGQVRLRPHASRSAQNYLQGAAATVQVAPEWQLTGFVSYRPMDATLNTDGTASTIVEGGYHRTQAEMDKKNNTHLFTSGANITLARAYYYIGITGVYHCLDRELRPNTQTLYRRYYAQGDRFWNASLQYGLTLGALNLHGETATGDSHALATLNQISWRATSSLRLRLLQRFYAMRYTALMASSMSDGGSVQNESGLYLGISWHPSHRLWADAYADVAYHPWAKYQVSQASHATDVQATVGWQPADGWRVTARYRLRRRQRDAADGTSLLWKTDQRARLALLFSAPNIEIRTQADYARASFETTSQGWMLSQHARWEATSGTRLTGSVAWFRTDEYDSRLYFYERGLLYDFSMPAYYGHGLRYMLMLRQRLGAHLSMTAKLGVTNYFDRSTVGTGYQQVNHSSLADIHLQLILKI